MLSMRALPCGVVGPDRDLPAAPGAGIDPERLQGDGEQPGRDLLARGDDGVVFARVVERREAGAPGDELVGGARHGGDDDRDLVARVHLALDPGGDVPDAVEVGHRGAAELHHDARHAKP